MDDVLDLNVGNSLWLDGQRWKVTELQADTVLLSSGTVIRRTNINSLVGRATNIEPRSDEQTPNSLEFSATDRALLDSLSESQHATLTERARVVESLLQAGIGDKQAKDRHEKAAQSLGIGVSTLYRLKKQYKERGPAGLVDTRLVRHARDQVTHEWDRICSDVLATYRDASNPTISTVISKTNRAYVAANPDAKTPSRSVAYVRVKQLDKGQYTFGAAKQRRSVAGRPKGVLSRLQSDRPGQYIVLDTNRLDVFALEPVSCRWVNVELTVGIDLNTRIITGLTLRPVAAQSVDVASVLYQTVTPQTWGRSPESPVGPYLGLPENVSAEEDSKASHELLPDSIIVDHGKAYLSRHVLSVCDRLGINVQPARPIQPTDKAVVERFFRTLRQSLLEHLPAYKGPDVYSRGKDIEKAAFLFVSELEQIIREWVGIYHDTPHSNLRDPHVPDIKLTPNQMFERGIAQSGTLRLPANDDIVMEFLEVEWRQIHHYGVEVNGRRYDGIGITPYRGRRSVYTGKHAGKWPIYVDRDDVRWVHFKDPADGTWHRLEWEHAHYLNAPFSSEAADYTRRLSTSDNTFHDPQTAILTLLKDWHENAVTDRRAKNLAKKVSATTNTTTGTNDPETDPRDRASTPGIIDLLTHTKTKNKSKVHDDLDVFDNDDGPEDEGFEVFDE